MNDSRNRQRRGFDLRLIRQCFGLAGVDEAGRGALAGPVVAGAVLVCRSFLESNWCRRHVPAINDSKQLTPDERGRVFERMNWLQQEGRIVFAAGTASVEEIETANIHGATRLAMRRALESALVSAKVEPHPPDPLFAVAQPVARAPGACITDWLVLIDGLPMRGLGFVHRAVVGGDARSLVIAMASIVAKVTRDRMMETLHAELPGYGFAQHKGYATPAHREALLALGACPHHRPLFVRTFLATNDDPAQTEFPFSEAAEAAFPECTSATDPAEAATG